MDKPDKTVPANLEAEEAVLGSLLIDPDAIIKIAAFLKADDFYREKNGWVYQAILDLHERREPADFVTVVDELERRERLQEAGGIAYISALINSVPTAVHVEYYARIVERTATLRRLIGAASQIASLAYEEAEDVNEVVDRAEQLVFSVAERRLRRNLVPVRQIMGDVVNRIEYLHSHKGELLGVPSGFSQLDRLLGGFQKSDLIVLAARPGVGKTALSLNIAVNAAKRYGQRVGFFSLEMSNEQLVQRLLSAETGIDQQRLRLGAINEDEWLLLMAAASELSETLLFIDDTPAMSALELRTKARRLQAEHGLDIVIVDYLQLMRGEGRNENRVQEISYITRSLKGLARELEVPLIALSQLSRAVEARSDHKPILSDLRESGCLAGDTLITLADSGARVRIRDLVGKAGLSIWALNPQTLQLERHEVTNAFSTGKKTVTRITTRLGRQLRATSNHRFLTIDGWKRLDELQVGETIALPRHMPSVLAPSMSHAELALLGHLIGHGCTLPRHAIQYTTREHNLAEMVAKLALEVFGAEVAPRINAERKWFQVYLSSTRRHTRGRHSAVSEWLAQLELWGLRSWEKRVPGKVFEQPAEQIAVFLRHLWATDGCILMRYGKAPYPSIYYATSSAALAGDVQSLLLRLGINARIRRSPQLNKGRDQYHVILGGQLDLLRFASVVGAVGAYKESCLREVAQFLSGTDENTNRDIIPKAVWLQYVKPAMVAAHISHRQLHAAMGMAYAGMTVFKQNISRERAGRVAEIVHSQELEALACSDIYWDQVAYLEANGDEEVYDLTVPGPANFVANDIIVHNSIEQDADIVMFIYREDMVKEDSERKKVADVIVAKHRNGPIDTVPLYFDPTLTRFADLEFTREPLEYGK